MTEEESIASLDLTGKKKKKKKPTKAVETAPEVVKDSKEEEGEEEEIDTRHLEEAPADDDTAFIDDEAKESETVVTKDVNTMKFASDTSYTYEELVERIFGLISAARPEEKVVYKMKPPVVFREGTSKTVWANFPNICKIINRSPEHVQLFTLAEVGSTGSIDGNARLVIKGRFQPKHIENILRRYISEYVKCHTCKSPETELKKENRLTFMVCKKCNSTRSVTTIKAGFTATTRASRRAASAAKI